MNNTVKTRGWFWNPEKLIMIKPYSWMCPIETPRTWQSKDGLLIISGNKLTINTGFRFNNATGVPSGDIDREPNLPVQSLTDQPVYILWRATVWHDAGYRYINEPEFPFTRLQLDNFFRDNCYNLNFKWTILYYWGVRIFGGISFWFNKIFRR